MTELLEPFTTMLDFRTGLLDPNREVVERRLSDMRGMYLEEPGDGDRLVYRVHGIPGPATTDNVLSSTTVIEPGTVGREYFMTKGHFHEIRGRAEIYVGLAGDGRLVMATEDGRVAVEPMRRGTVNYVPGGWSHRSVNVGDEPLVFFAAYPGDAGYDYGTIEERGFPVLVVRGADGPEVVENPRWRP
ncbi:MAG: glucose-6-phosphate isomerase family protein [Gaiellaceae bacterium]